MIILTSNLAVTRYGDLIRQAAPDAQLIGASIDQVPDAARDAEVVYFAEGVWASDFQRSLLPRLVELPRLRWLHTFTHGVDNPLFARLLERGVAVSRSLNAMNQPIAQYVLAMMLRIAKRMDLWIDAQRESRWTPHQGVELTNSTVAVIGTGQVGGEIARLCHAFEMRVIGCRRDPVPTEHVDEMFPITELHAVLARADYVVLALPLNRSTFHMFDEAALRAMKPSAWLINVARGTLVDEAVLIRALRERWIGGACLDVFEQEPLPSTSELWTLPNTMITPHNSLGGSTLALQRAATIFARNLRQFVRGEPLEHQVHAIAADTLAS